MRYRFLSVFVFAALFCLKASADVVTFKNGNTLEGEVVEESAEALRINVGSGVIGIARSEIASVEKKPWTPPPAPLKPAKETLPPPTPLQQAIDWVKSKIDPWLQNRGGAFTYAAVIQDLKKIHFEANVYTINEGVSRVTMGQLIANGRLPLSFKEGVVNGYRYSIRALSSGVRISADPVEANSGKKHFMMDEHSYIYAEDGKPATPLSPRYNTGYLFEVKPT